MRKLLFMVLMVVLVSMLTSEAFAQASSRACRDGIDNDGDGKIDYPNDPGCTSRNDRDETDPIVSPPPPPSPPPATTGTVALTFDDGPDPTGTTRVLDILKSKNVKGTFFLIGQYVLDYPDVARRVYAEGHRAQNHTYTHPHLTTLSDSQVRQELTDANAAIVANGAPQPDLFRPPYLETDDRIKSIGASLGLTQVLKDVDSLDWQNISSQTICNNVVSGVRQGGRIVLLHDAWSRNTPDALPCIIDTLRADGYTFGLVYPSGIS